MIDPQAIQRLAIQHQTTTQNIAREYCQHLFLSAFYQQAAAERVLFKGGTALRIVYGSPRFSEDLDFSGVGVRRHTIEGLLMDTLVDVERVGVALEIEEAKATSGGYLGIIRSRVLDFHVTIQVEVSLRGRAASTRPATVLVASDVIPAYTVLTLPTEQLVEEKLRALLERAASRDFYDLYFIIRKGLLPVTRRHLLKAVHRRLMQMPPTSFQELTFFLPRNQHRLVKQFRMTLDRELRPYV